MNLLLVESMHFILMFVFWERMQRTQSQNLANVLYETFQISGARVQKTKKLTSVRPYKNFPTNIISDSEKMNICF